MIMHALCVCVCLSIQQLLYIPAYNTNMYTILCMCVCLHVCVRACVTHSIVNCAVPHPFYAFVCINILGKNIVLS